MIDSPLSEAGVLGFEYGYSLAEPQALVIWEAQFGDFANGAQVIIDQFITSGEAKWLRMSGLVMLLPHGYEGQGPEHSSARLERYLQLCAEDNMQVVNCTTPAQLFPRAAPPGAPQLPQAADRHDAEVAAAAQALRVDARRDGAGHQLPPRARRQPAALRADAEVQRVVLCTGKVYYDLLEERAKRGIDDVAIMRLEQLYPFPAKALTAGARALPAGRGGLVPGGAEEHGRLELRRAGDRGGAWPSIGSRQSAAALCRPAGRGGAGDRPAAPPSQGAGRSSSTRR